jgi:hypothetical protein
VRCGTGRFVAVEMVSAAGYSVLDIPSRKPLPVLRTLQACSCRLILLCDNSNSVLIFLYNSRADVNLNRMPAGTVAYKCPISISSHGYLREADSAGYRRARRPAFCTNISRSGYIAALLARYPHLVARRMRFDQAKLTSDLGSCRRTICAMSKKAPAGDL